MNKAGFKVLLIDKSDESIGGDCLNFGCVPSKALIHLSKMFYHARIASNFGMKISSKADIKKINKYIHEKKEIIRKHENASYFREKGLDVVLGLAKFIGENSIEVSGVKYSSKKIIIATGSSPKKLNVKGLENVKEIYTNETIFSLNKLPKNLLVIGAGPIGIELGQAFSRLGSKVTIIQKGKNFLPKEQEEITNILKKQLEEEGIKFHLNSTPIKFDSSKSLIIRKGTEEIKIKFDAVLSSIGRKLNIPEGLDKAGIRLSEDKRRILVDDYLRTTNKNILLCGDIVGSYQFTHAAELHASVILRNFFSPFKKKLVNDNLSWVTYTDPEIASFGLSEAELNKRSVNYKKISEDFSTTDRGITDSSNGKLILFIQKNKILGGSIIAPNAGEIVQELILANSTKINIKKLFNKIYPYPTASRINKTAITKVFVGKLTPFSKRLLRFLY